jgi:hypothetical protein
VPLSVFGETATNNVANYQKTVTQGDIFPERRSHKRKILVIPGVAVLPVGIPVNKNLYKYIFINLI